MFKSEFQKIILSSFIVAIVTSAITSSIFFYGFDLAKPESQLNQPIKTTVVEEESESIKAIEEVSPAVVSVIISKELQQYYSNPFDFFSRNPREQSQENNTEPEIRKVGGGTGFVVTEDGLTLTNRHVVSDVNAEFTVVLNDETTYYASVVSRDPTNDLAVLQLFTDEERTNKPDGLPVLNLGDSDKLKIGSKVIAIGNALSEFSNTTTAGIISGKGRSIVAGGSSQQSTSLTNLLQTDAAINPGNSGGPLINLNGEVIGINTAIAQQANGIGFAIPINDVKAAIKSVEENGRIIRPYLGVRYTELSPAIAKELGLETEYGAYLLDDVQSRTRAVLEGSPAAKAGIRSGDIITEINSENIDDKSSLGQLISKYSVGETIKATVLRGGDSVTLSIKLEEFEQEAE
jgi:S1-C subfamily serine protease